MPGGVKCFARHLEECVERTNGFVRRLLQSIVVVDIDFFVVRIFVVLVVWTSRVASRPAAAVVVPRPLDALHSGSKADRGYRTSRRRRRQRRRRRRQRRRRLMDASAMSVLPVRSAGSRSAVTGGGRGSGGGGRSTGAENVGDAEWRQRLVRVTRRLDLNLREAQYRLVGSHFRRRRRRRRFEARHPVQYVGQRGGR